MTPHIQHTALVAECPECNSPEAIAARRAARIVVPTRLVVSTGRNVQPTLFMAHRATRWERVVAWLKAVRHGWA